MKKKKLLTIGLTATLLFSNQLPTMQALAVANEEATEQVEKTDSEVEKDTKLPVVDETPEPETPKEPEVPATPEVPETPEAPTEVPETPEIEVPETPAAPEVTEPSEPEVPETPSAPEVTEPTTEDSEVQVETVKPEAEETKKVAKKPTKQVEKADKEEKEDKADNKAEGENVIVDDNLREAILRQLNEYEDENPQKPVTKEMLEGLTELDASYQNIRSLSGLEYAENMDYLSLNYIYTSDISSLSKLTKLTTLSLVGNRISDISALSGLEKLSILYLNNNSIQDISPLAQLKKVSTLYLGNNKVEDISDLSALSNLKNLFLNNNSIKDVSILNGKSLFIIDVSGNNISDLSPLQGNFGYFYNQEVTIDLTNEGTKFTSPLIDENGNRRWLDASIPGLSGMDSNGVVQIDHNVLLNEVASPAFPSWNVTIIDNSEKTNFAGIEDANLLVAIEQTLGKKITSYDDLKDLETLDATKLGITSLKGLEHATNLTELDVSYNQIADISPLASLTKLTSLSLGNNKIKDAKVLANLASLSHLDISNNYIADISPLKNVTNAMIAPQTVKIDLTDKQEYFISPLKDLDGNYAWIVQDIGFNISGLSKMDENGRINITKGELAERSHGVADYWAVEVVDYSEKNGSHGIEDPELLKGISRHLDKKIVTKDDLKEVTEVTISNKVQSLKGLENAVNLARVNFYQKNPSLTDYTALAELPITELTFNDCLVDDYVDLPNLNNVKRLIAQKSRSNDWDKFLNAFRQLDYLNGMATLFLTKIIRCCECCGVMAPIALDNEHPRI